MDLKFFRLLGSSESLLSMGVTTVCFRGEGMIPVEREILKMCVKENIIEKEGYWSRYGRKGSRGQCVKWASKKNLLISSVVAESEDANIDMWR